MDNHVLKSWLSLTFAIQPSSLTLNRSMKGYTETSYSISKYRSTTFLRFYLLENAQRDRV
jgi:hypothetical protein